MKHHDLMLLIVVSLSYAVITVIGLECSSQVPLGMESGTISDSQITASSFYGGQGGLTAIKGRLNNADYWATMAGDPTDPWIQVDLLQTACRLVTGIKTQGSAHSIQEWVKTLKIQYGDSESTLTYIMEGASPKIFAANTNKNTPVAITFPEPLNTRIIRIRPTTWHDWCSLRFEVIGCIIDCAPPSRPLCVSNRAERYRVIDKIADTWSNARLYCQSLGSRADLVVIDSDEELDYVRNLVSGSTLTGFWLGLSDAEQEDTWSNHARLYCQSLGSRADLVVIDSDEELDYVRNPVSGSTLTGFWLGLSDAEQEGTWKWIGYNGIGVEFSASSWHSGEPTGGVNDNCAIFLKSTDPVRGYGDAPCVSAYPFICEFSKCQEEQLTIEDGYRLQNQLSYRVKVERLSKCTKACLRDRECRSVNLIPIMNEANSYWCEINNSKKEDTSASDFSPSNGGIYAGII